MFADCNMIPSTYPFAASKTYKSKNVRQKKKLKCCSILWSELGFLVLPVTLFLLVAKLPNVSLCPSSGYPSENLRGV